MTEEQIREMFRYRAPDESQRKTFEANRAIMTETAVSVAGTLPDSRERALFLTHMQHAQMMANAAVALHGPRK